jgi:hypothetical protein
LALALEDEPDGVPEADAADVLENAEEIVSAVAPDALSEARDRERKEQRKSGKDGGFGSRRWFKRKD